MLPYCLLASVFDKGSGRRILTMLSLIFFAIGGMYCGIMYGGSVHGGFAFLFIICPALSLIYGPRLLRRVSESAPPKCLRFDRSLSRFSYENKGMVLDFQREEARFLRAEGGILFFEVRGFECSFPESTQAVGNLATGNILSPTILPSFSSMYTRRWLRFVVKFENDLLTIHVINIRGDEESFS